MNILLPLEACLDLWLYIARFIYPLRSMNLQDWKNSYPKNTILLNNSNYIGKIELLSGTFYLKYKNTLLILFSFGI